MSGSNELPDLACMDLAELSSWIHAGRITPLEVVEACLARIARYDGAVRSFVTIDADSARRSARIAGEELAAGHDRGAFHGIPFALKDNIDTAGLRTTSHSRQDIDVVPDSDAYVVTRLREAGGILLGKLATFEFAIGGPAWDLPWPPALNPWNTDFLPGGSSSGAGAAVAARFVPAAIGTDTGGSVRWPAAVCGIVGMKPTYGLISRRGVAPNTFSLDHCGPMTRTVRDNALMLQASAGFDPRDPGSANRKLPDYAAALTGDIGGLRIGLVRRWYADEAQPEVTKAVDAAAARLAELGAVVETVDLGDLQPYIDCKTIISSAELYAVHEKDLKTRPQGFSRMLRERVMGGVFLRAEHYVQALRWRSELARLLLAQFARFDLLATAGWLSTADAANPETSDFFRALRLVTMPFSLAGNPAMVLPCGFAANGLPLSLQLAAKPFDEATVYRCGDAYQLATDWHLRVPALREAA
jgi:aspartyl-tRNA(Asn)/glutamyl-tRNA(Gln) amidotransferase subunit A